MIDKLQSIIKKQDGLLAAFEEQLKADQTLINSQEKQIQVLEETIAIQKKEQQELFEAGNDMAAASRELEKICCKQQELLDSFLSEQ